MVWDQEIVSSNLATPTKPVIGRAFLFMTYIVYILYSASKRKYYTGQTQNLDKRILEHNSGETVSIRNGIPWKLVWSRELTTRSEAIRLEKTIKSRGAARFLSDQNR